jgi:hypothetical protein
MSKIRQETPDGDYSFGQGLLNFYINVPATVGLAVKEALLLWLGEWYLDTTVGTPFMQGILGKYSKAEADSTIQDQVLQVDGVVSIDNYVSTLDPVTRSLTVSFDLNTIFGTTQIQMQNFLNY